jgi:hypothetical protein
MYQQILDFFKLQDWKYTEIKGKTIVMLGISGENGEFQCIADVNEVEKTLLFLSICSINVPEEKKLSMSELLTRLNFGKFLGNFEMDFEDGEIRYKTSLYFENESAQPQIIENIIMTNILAMDTSLPAILSVINETVTPLQAFLLLKNTEE